MEAIKKHKVYKGIKKPLVAFGLKGKYIYYAFGSILLGLVSTAILNNFIGIVGMLIGASIAVGGFLFVNHLQETVGLFNKTKTKKEILIIENRLNFKGYKLHDKEKNI